MLNEGELNDLKVSESDAYLEGMKRYSEFVSLHNKLLKSSNHARLVKGNRISSCLSISLAVQHTCTLHEHTFLRDCTHTLCFHF